jgi:hypothetical protein
LVWCFDVYMEPFGTVQNIADSGFADPQCSLSGRGIHMHEVTTGPIMTIMCHRQPWREWLVITQDPGQPMGTNLSIVDPDNAIARARFTGTQPWPTAIETQPFMGTMLDTIPEFLQNGRSCCKAFTASRTEMRCGGSSESGRKRRCADITQQGDRHNSILLMDSMRMCARQPVECAGVR